MRAVKFITGHAIYNLAYTYKFQLKTTKANLNLSERMSEFCTQINQTRFDKSLMNKEQNKIYEEWIDKCGYNDYMAKWPLRKDFLMVSNQFFEVV
jgi:hypothetical protein